MQTGVTTDVPADIIAASAALIALISLVLAIVATASSRRAAERATVATEKMASIQSRIFEGPAWSLRNLGGAEYLVTNDSAIAAENVRFRHDPPIERFWPQDEDGVTIGSKSGTKFRAAYGMADGDSMKRDLVITWTRPGEDTELTWRHPIPPRT